jgi:glycosyltransferase involved in cell wall biosynthesis
VTPSAPAVSVAIPCYRVTAYICEALDSLRRQTFRNFEVILVNDGCPDTTNLERALRPYEGEFRYINQKNGGPSSARNAAILAARAPLVAFLDGDDLLEPDYLRAQIEILASNPEIDVVYPDVLFFGGSRWDGSLTSERMPSRGEIGLRGLLEGTCHVYVGAVSRRETLIRAGLMDPAIRMAEDLDLWVRVCKAGGKIMYCNQPLARHRMRDTSASDDKLAILHGAIRVYEKSLRTLDLTAEERGWFNGATRRMESQIDYYLGRKALYEENRTEAIERLRSANIVMKDGKLSLIVATLKLFPRLAYFYVHRKYPTQYLYLH